MENTRHRLCIWHIIKNAVSRFGALKRDTEFKKKFNSCLRGCITAEEFEMEWNNMIKDFKLENSKWFKRLYNIREKWCTTLNKDFFSAGILSSQRSESTNNAIGFKASKSTSLTDFFKIFDETIRRWRKNETDQDFKCLNSESESDYSMTGIMRDAMQRYTTTIFREVEAEYSHALGSILKLLDQVGSAHMYEVWLEGKEQTKQRVSFDSLTQQVECSCKNFEEVGWLCFHSLRVLIQHSLTSIPPKYIKKRWTKLAKEEIWNKRKQQNTNNEIQQEYTPWRTTMATKAYNLILKSQQYKETRAVIEENYKNMTIKVQQIIESKQSEEAAQNTNEENQEENQHQQAIEIPTVQDPDRANTKGRNKRIKGFFDKGKQPKQKKTKAMTAKGDGVEYGSFTPIIKPTLI